MQAWNFSFNITSKYLIFHKCAHAYFHRCGHIHISTHAYSHAYVWLGQID